MGDVMTDNSKKTKKETKTLESVQPEQVLPVVDGLAVTESGAVPFDTGFRIIESPDPEVNVGPIDAVELAQGHAELDAELTQMNVGVQVLASAGLVSPEQAQRTTEEVEKSRRNFRDLPREQQRSIIERRRKLGRNMANKSLPGASVIEVTIVLRHTRLRPVFEQWWPYFNRMTVNMQRFGYQVFGKPDFNALNTYFVNTVRKIDESVSESLTVAQGFKDREFNRLTAGDEHVFEPSVTNPSLTAEVVCFSPLSHSLLQVLKKFDEAMDIYDWLVWNGSRNQSDIDDEVSRFLRKLADVGIRGYTTHMRLMTSLPAPR